MQIQTRLPSKGKLDPKSQVKKSVPMPQPTTVQPVIKPLSVSLDRLKALKKLAKPTQKAPEKVVLEPQLETIVPELPVYNPKTEQVKGIEEINEVEEVESDFSEFDHPKSAEDIKEKQSFFRNPFNNANKNKKQENKPWINNKTAASNPSDLEAMFFNEDD